MEFDTEEYIPMPVEVEMGNYPILEIDSIKNVSLGSKKQVDMIYKHKFNNNHRKYRRKIESELFGKSFVTPRIKHINSKNNEFGTRIRVYKKDDSYFLSSGDSTGEVEIIRKSATLPQKLQNAIQYFDCTTIEEPLLFERSDVTQMKTESEVTNSEDGDIDIIEMPLKVNLLIDGEQEETNLECTDTRKLISDEDLALHFLKSPLNGSGELCKQALMQCDFCEKALPTKQMAKHRRVHTNERPFWCKTCGMRFKQTSHLNKHQKIHNPVRPHECKECGKTFLELSVLRIHRAIHAGTGPYKCELCPATCRSANDLTKHRRVHTNERPYNCQLCQKRFKQIGHLKTHMALHSDQRPFKCDVCSKTFVLSGHLKVHQVLHTGIRPFKCDKCDRAYASNGKLTQHKKSHLNERPFQCGFCEKSYMARCDLNVHLNKHSGATPYVCIVCSIGFGRRSNLNKHIQRVHTTMN